MHDFVEPFAVAERTDKPGSHGASDVARVHRLAEFDQPCPYLPGLVARYESYHIDVLPGDMYERLMGAGFRRSGMIVYRPRCTACSACRPLRVVVDRFHASRSQRRVLRRNTDLRVESGRPIPTRAKFDLFTRYLDSRHDAAMSRDYGSFCTFLYQGPTSTWELSYFAGDRLVAVSLVDVCPSGLSSVYVYFDPDDSARSPGHYSALHEIELCRRQGRPYYYLGYWVRGAVTMDYKDRFSPNEILGEDGVWRAHRG